MILDMFDVFFGSSKQQGCGWWMDDGWLIWREKTGCNRGEAMGLD